MISEIIIYAVVQVVSFFTAFLPGAGQVPLLLPWGTDAILLQAVTGYKLLAGAFPPFQTILTAFIIYLLFRIALKMLKVVPFVGNMIES